MIDFNSIVKYLSFLETEYSLFVSVHYLYEPLKSQMIKLGKYNTHYHPFCMHIKKQRVLWDMCLKMQYKVIKCCKNDIFYGSCYAGVEEYILPITVKGQMVGFVSVTGYCTDKEKTKQKLSAVSRQHNIDYSQLLDKLSSLSSAPPSIELIEALLLHVADMFGNTDCGDKQCSNFLIENNAEYIAANAIAFVDNNYTKNIHVSDIAEFCHCSCSYITHISKYIGMGFNEYINKLRINEAKSLLSGTSEPINIIGYNVGYNNSNYFSNVFYKQTGMYPREYRNSVTHNKHL